MWHTPCSIGYSRAHFGHSSEMERNNWGLWIMSCSIAALWPTLGFCSCGSLRLGSSLCSSLPPLLGALFNEACLPGFHRCVGTWSLQWQQRLLWRYGSLKWLTLVNTHLLFFSTLIEGGPEHIIFIGRMIRLSVYLLHKYTRISPSVEIPYEGKMWNLLLPPRQAGHP